MNFILYNVLTLKFSRKVKNMTKLNFKHTLAASCIGYFTQAIVNNFAPLLFIIFQNTYKISIELITFIITVNFFVQLSVDLLSAKFVDKIGKYVVWGK